MKTFADFFQAVQRDLPADLAAGLREGQHAFNFLLDHRPALAEAIRGRAEIVNPYYLDRNLPAFWALVEHLWDDQFFNVGRYEVGSNLRLQVVIAFEHGVRFGKAGAR